MTRLIIFFALCLNSSVFALEERELANLLEQYREDRNMPGLRAAIRFSDGNIVTAAVGLADLENDLPLNTEVGMPGGSTGKSFVAVLTMMLVEDGIISTEDFASDYLRHTEWFEDLPNAESIQIKHLLSHSSGVRDYPQSIRCGISSVWRTLRRGSNEFTPEELIDCVVNKRPLFPVGQGYYYTDAGYLILGRLIESVSGRNYYELLQEKILDPLELDQISPQDREVLPNITPGYASGARTLREDGSSKYNPTTEWTGGGLVTNPTMLVEFYGALVDGELISRESLDQMLEGEWQNPEDDSFHYGYGFFVYPNSDSFGHGGMWPGYRTQVLHDENSGVTIAVQTNRDGSIDLPSVIRGISESIQD